jgi:hypothetical protein
MGVSGDTRIQTKTGCPKIADVAEREMIQPWEGKQWMKDPIRLPRAGPKAKMYRVSLSDGAQPFEYMSPLRSLTLCRGLELGSYLDCTRDHWWTVKRQGRCFGTLTNTATVDLKVGDTIPSFRIDGSIEGRHDLNATEVAFDLNKASIEMFLLKNETKQHSEETARDIQMLARRVGQDFCVTDQGFVSRTKEPQQVTSVVKLEEPMEAYKVPVGIVLNNCMVL